MKVSKIFLLFIVFTALISCNKDEERTCTQCNAEATESFELCEEPDGNASVNGENTGTDYDTYFEGLVTAGVSCGG